MRSIEMNLSKFKSNKVNFNISLHDPKEQGEKYLRTLIYLMAESMTDSMFKQLRNVKGRMKGHPIGIMYKGEPMCLDYLQAVYETDFIDKYVDMAGLDILEIGAGYGRTAHTILSNYNVRSYTIADLENCLALAYRYLEEVLPADVFGKINFVPIETVSLNKDFDLCICIDAFSELDEGEAEQYVRYVNEHCKYFYLKTQLCKYPVEVFNATEGRMLKLTLNNKFDTINVVDDKDVKEMVPRFISVYHPGPDWKCVGNSNAKPYMHYWNAMYKK
jgi:putative sugar O-methyltransferase